jgi:hypothetical protein
MSETNERPILDRLATFFDDYDAFYNEPVPMLATQLCADAHAEITSLRAQLEEARAKSIEECAKIADSYRWNAFSQGRMPLAKAFEMLADDIRALLSAPTEARSALEASK